MSSDVAATSSGPQAAAKRPPKRHARQTSTKLGGLVVSNGLAFLTLILVSRGFGQYGAGVFFEGFALLRVLTVVATLGLDVALVRYVATARAGDDGSLVRAVTRLGFVVAVAASLLGMVIVYITAPWLAELLGGGSEATFVFKAMGASLPGTVITAVLAGALIGDRRMGSAVWIDDLAQSGSRFAGVALAIFLGAGLHGASIGFAIGSTVPAFLGLVLAWPLLFGDAISTREIGLRGLAQFTGFQWASSLANQALLWADTLLLGIWRPPSQVAVYSVSARTMTLAAIIVLPIGIALQPAFAEAVSIGDTGRLRWLYTAATRWSTVLGFPVLLALALAPAAWLGVLYGHRYETGAVVLVLLALGSLMDAGTGPCQRVVTMSGRADLTLLRTGIALGLNVAANIILIPVYGATGAAAAWAFALIVSNLVSLFQVKWVLGVQPFSGWPLRVSAALLSFVAVFVAARLIVGDNTIVGLAAAVIPSTLVYIGALRMLDLATPQQLGWKSLDGSGAMGRLRSLRAPHSR